MQWVAACVCVCSSCSSRLFPKNEPIVDVDALAFEYTNSTIYCIQTRSNLFLVHRILVFCFLSHFVIQCSGALPFVHIPLGAFNCMHFHDICMYLWVPDRERARASEYVCARWKLVCRHKWMKLCKIYAYIFDIYGQCDSSAVQCSAVQFDSLLLFLAFYYLLCCSKWIIVQIRCAWNIMSACLSVCLSLPKRMHVCSAAHLNFAFDCIICYCFG